MKLNEKTTLEQIYNANCFDTVKDCLISGGDFFKGNNIKMTLAELHKKNPTWAACDMIYGLEHLAESRFKMFPLSESQNVNLIYLPAEKRTKDYYVVLLAGGAYGSVCTMIEALPVAAKLNEMGVNCFCLNYKTADATSFEKGLFPAPLNSLADALKFIERQQANFEIDASNYVLCGFSAGGHLASLWGIGEVGAQSYGLSQPKTLFLAYPLITMENVPDSTLKNYMCTGMFGKGYTLETIRKYDASRHADSEYPPVYIVRAEDDNTVCMQDANALKAALDAADVSCVIEQAQTGGHGFGLGSETPFDGWVERAVDFINKPR